ncbi:MAG TPA: bifunctional adenosylcobinamide kinase/adenosylcobinamide-phosphate guanylyltransferase [Ottowia sp.]|nr:bifunctional adenosylcobinamide kinase/adenosylcobinamide-phosphate guanylyltransferase [Ottowia sp.]
MAGVAHTLILGGARSGKSRRAEALAATWLAAAPRRQAVLLATACVGDSEMAQRIHRHQVDRAARAPALATVEVPLALPAALRAQGAPQRLLVVDCLTLWLTQCLMPIAGPGMDETAWDAEEAALLQALRDSASPVVLVSNEIGLGVLPLSREARHFVDALGRLHQRVAAQCSRVTLMVAGLPLHLKERA